MTVPASSRRWQGASRRTAPDAVSIDGDRVWTFGASSTRLTARFANASAADGLGVGDRIAILGRNSAEWLLVYFGSTRAGTVFLPLNHHLQHDELVYILRDSATRLLFCDAEHEERAQRPRREAGVERVQVIDDMFGGWLDRRLDVWPAGSVGGVAMAYTSGTTGRPKGLEPAPQTRTAEQVVEDMDASRRSTAIGAAACTWSPRPWTMARRRCTRFMAAAMGQTVVIERRFDAAEALALIERHRVTTTHLVPTQIIRLLRLPDETRRQRADLSSLKAIFHGAAPCPPWAKRGAIEWLGPILIEYFGAKEGCGPFLCTSTDWLARPGTVGRPGSHIAVTVVGDDGNDLPPGEIGTLYFRRADGRDSDLPRRRGQDAGEPASRRSLHRRRHGLARRRRLSLSRRPPRRSHPHRRRQRLSRRGRGRRSGSIPRSRTAPSTACPTRSGESR